MFSRDEKQLLKDKREKERNEMRRVLDEQVAEKQRRKEAERVRRSEENFRLTARGEAEGGFTSKEIEEVKEVTATEQKAVPGLDEIAEENICKDSPQRAELAPLEAPHEEPVNPKIKYDNIELFKSQLEVLPLDQLGPE